MDFALAPGEQELERGRAKNYRGMFDEDNGEYILTNGRLVHVQYPWYLDPERRGTALLYFIAWLCGWKPTYITQQVELNSIASLQFMSYMFTTGYKVRDIYGREFELHLGWQSTAEPWRDRVIGLIQTANPNVRVASQGDVIFFQR